MRPSISMLKLFIRSKADVGKTQRGRIPNKVLIYKKTAQFYTLIYQSQEAYVNAVLLTCSAGGYFLTLLPGGLLFPLILRTNWISRLLSALTDTYSPFFAVCSLPLSFIYPYCLPLRVADATRNRKEKSKGNHNVQTDRSHYALKMCGKTEMDNRWKTAVLSQAILSLQQHDQCNGLHAFIM